MTVMKLGLKFAAAAAFLLCAPLAHAQPANMTKASGGDLMTKDLLAAPGKEVVMTTVVYPPGGSSPAHRHNAQVFVYVLEGHEALYPPVR